jgi:stage II sporulation protein D
MRRRRLLAIGVATLGAIMAGACSAGGGPVRTTGNPPPESARDVRRKAPEVRVRLTAPDRAGRAGVRVAGSWQLLDLGGAVLASGRGLDGAMVLSGSAATLAGHTLPRDGAILRPATSGDLRIGERRYPGELRIARSVDGKHRPYAAMDLETYVAGVVPGEIPAQFPREAQRTQAILARTYALSSIPWETLGAPIVVADSGGVDQEYHGIPNVQKHREIAADAAQSTRGVVLLDGAVPLRAWYHSTCGGHTAAATSVFGVEPRVSLSGVACEWCTSSKYYRWDAQLPKDAVLRAAGMSPRLPLEGFDVARRDDAGRATHFRVHAGGKSKEVEAARFRLAVGASRLRSCLLDQASVDGQGVHVKGRGWGHGVGLCQIGAKTLAEQSLLARDIVRTYYPGVQVVRLW